MFFRLRGLSVLLHSLTVCVLAALALNVNANLKL